MSKEHILNKARERFLEGIGVPELEAFVVDDFQREAIDLVVNGVDTLVVAPTGSGKTFIALDAIRSTMELGHRAIYTTPLKALSNTKYTDLKRRFEPQFQVGLLTGDRKIDGDANVVVATTEIYRNELYKSHPRYSVVVLDEVHFIADQQRGAVWEESIILTPTSSTLLMLSASISNAPEISAWISEVRGKECRVVSKRDRPVELRYGFIHPDLGVIPIADESGRVFEPVTRYYSSFGLDPSGMRLRKVKNDKQGTFGERERHHKKKPRGRR